MQDINTLFQVFGGLGILLAGIGYGYGQFRKGQRVADEETITSLQRQLDTIKTELTELKTENKELRDQNNQLIGKIEIYEKAITLQSPQIKSLETMIKKTSENVDQMLKCVKA